MSVSLWDHKEDADTYHRGTYPAVLKALAKVVEGTPQVLTYEVSNSTFHKIVTRAAVVRWELEVRCRVQQHRTA